MRTDSTVSARLVKAVHGGRAPVADPDWELGLSEKLGSAYGAEGLLELYGRFSSGDGLVDALMRRSVWRSLAARCGSGLSVGSGAGFKHLETVSLGDGVFIGAQAYVQGRHDGRCEIGDRVWIGPQCFLDARMLVIEDFVGMGPGSKVLGSTHTGSPVDIPVVSTDLEIEPVRICAWADIGTNATILPGVTIGKGAIVGAGAVVASDVAPFTVVAGVPAELLYHRADRAPPSAATSNGERR